MREVHSVRSKEFGGRRLVNGDKTMAVDGTKVVEAFRKSDDRSPLGARSQGYNRKRS